MSYDIEVTAAQLAYAGEWVAQEGADVQLRVDSGVLTIAQGDDRFMVNPDGSEDPGCTHCGMPEAVHASGDREYGHAYEPVPEDPEECTCPDGPFEGEPDVRVHDRLCPRREQLVRLAAQDDARGERDR